MHRRSVERSGDCMHRLSKARATLIAGFGSVLLTLSAGGALAQDETLPNADILPGFDMDAAVDPSTFNIEGGWEYVSEWGAGLIDIYRDGDAVVLELVSGSTCDPREMCTLSGGIEDLALIVSVEAAVPSGGAATSSFVIYFLSDTEAQGLGTSVWRGEGREMRWNYTISMTRPGTGDEEDAEPLND